MNMDSQDNKKPIPLLKSFSYAIEGIFTAARTERNMQIHLTVSVIVIACSIFFSISKMDWLLILFAIGGMIALELVNSAIERVVDLVTGEYHPLAKQAKDLAAGAVFVYAILSVVIGIIIFGPYVVSFILKG
jgi:undecaprenol kinase